MLVATGVAADGGHFPLAFSVISIENAKNWKWFFSCMQYYIASVREPRKITFISDRMNCIDVGLREGWTSRHHHRYCLHHLKVNFKKAVWDNDSENWFYQADVASDELT